MEGKIKVLTLHAYKGCHMSLFSQLYRYEGFITILCDRHDLLRRTEMKYQIKTRLQRYLLFVLYERCNDDDKG